jgi:hypothetical protein
MTRRFAAAVAALALTTTLAARGDEKLGAGVTLTEATSIAALYEKPQDYLGKTIRVDGIVTGVCSEMGCWMALGDDEKGTRTVRFKVDHGVSIVFPIKAKGMNASAQGVFEKIADAEGREAASEDKSATAFGKAYQIKATGAILK